MYNEAYKMRKLLGSVYTWVIIHIATFIELVYAVYKNFSIQDPRECF